MMIFIKLQRIAIILPILLHFFTNQAMAECTSFYSALVFDDKNNKILFENRADEIIYPASITKMMTAHLLFKALEEKRLSLEHKITISENAQDVGGINKINTMNLRAGDQITVEDALRGMLVKSFNESATALAEAIAGDEWSFAQMMNAKAEELKMEHTNFRNASGLHEAGHYTTNYDLARLVNALEKEFPQYRKYFALKEFVYNGVKYKSTNHILLEYKGADGFKTGFTNAAGFNLIASAKREGERINAVLTGCESYQKRDDFMKSLLDNGFEQVKYKNADLISLLKN